jgi:type II secretory pathway component PulF
MFSPQISLSQLVQLCRRLALAYSSGIDLRRIWQREAESARGRAKTIATIVLQEVSRGQSLGQAFNTAGAFYPSLFREMVEVGEQTGRLAEVFERLAQYYEFIQELRRTMIRAMVWPAIQLVVALTVVGLLILVLGIIQPEPSGDMPNFDPTGMGLLGVSGFFKYLALLATIGLTGAFLVFSVQRGWLRIDPIMGVVMRIPVIGKFLECMALARLSWAFGLGFDTGLDARRMVQVALRSSGNPYYSSRLPDVERTIARHGEFHAAFQEAGVFPVEFIDILRIGEMSGSVGQAMERLTREYESRARLLGNSLTVVFGFAVWGMVALLILYFIFQLAMQYIGILERATQI